MFMLGPNEGNQINWLVLCLSLLGKIVILLLLISGIVDIFLCFVVT